MLALDKICRMPQLMKIKPLIVNQIITNFGAKVVATARVHERTSGLCQRY